MYKLLLGLAGIIAVIFAKFGKVILVALGIGAAAVWSAADVNDYVDNTLNSDFIGSTIIEGVTVKTVRAEDRVFVTEYNVTAEGWDNYYMSMLANYLSCDVEGNKEILAKVESYKDVFIIENHPTETYVTTIGDCGVE